MIVNQIISSADDGKIHMTHLVVAAAAAVVVVLTDWAEKMKADGHTHTHSILHNLYNTYHWIWLILITTNSIYDNNNSLYKDYKRDAPCILKANVQLHRVFGLGNGSLSLCVPLFDCTAPGATTTPLWPQQGLEKLQKQKKNKLRGLLRLSPNSWQ